MGAARSDIKSPSNVSPTHPQTERHSGATGRPWDFRPTPRCADDSPDLRENPIDTPNAPALKPPKGAPRESSRRLDPRRRRSSMITDQFRTTATVAPDPGRAELAIVVISYNTCALTLRCIETVRQTVRRTRYRIVVWDNASTDGSADAIAARHPDVDLVRSNENLGFARANNAVVETLAEPWLLLLNPDTEVHPGAIDALMAFAAARPGNGIYGGRTVFPDGGLNIASCWNRITPWSAFCYASGLTFLFRRTALFDPEAIGGWRRDSEREVDIVVGCFLLTTTALWRRLGGFNPKYWMYGEEADLCLRARALGFRPIITPDATIMHLVGAASATRAEKIALLAKARVSLMRDHWPSVWRPWAGASMWLWGAVRRLGAEALALRGGEEALRRRALWRSVWSARRDWLAGY